MAGAGWGGSGRGGGEEQSRGKVCKGTWEPSGQTEARGKFAGLLPVSQHQC